MQMYALIFCIAFAAFGCGKLDKSDQLEIGYDTNGACGLASQELQDVNGGDFSQTLLPGSYVNSFKGSAGGTAAGNTPPSFCSGTLISENLYITAGHCGIGRSVLFSYESGRPSKAFRITGIAEISQFPVDYAILRLDGNPGKEFGFRPVRASAVNSSEPLAMFQHPGGRPKKVDFGVMDYPTQTDNLLLSTSLYSQGGSSGSGILDEEGQLVAVHGGGNCDDQGRNFTVSLRITKAIERSAILRRLAQ